MSEHDENNIEFVLSLNPAEVGIWISSMNQDELSYALSIVECAQWKLLDEYVQSEQDCSQAKKLLKTLFHVN